MNSLIGLRLLLRGSCLFSILISIATILIFSPSISFAKDAAMIFKENNKAVVVVVAYDEKCEAISQGSGFVIKADRAVE